MENSFQTSFIPKRPITPEPVRSRRPVSILSFLSIVLLVGVGIAAGGLYFYKGMLVRQISSFQQSLNRAKQSFEPETIVDLQTFDKRMSVSKQVLAMHSGFSPLFTTISELTIPSIQFTKFSTLKNEDGQSVTVRMSGLALDYKSIALQAQVFNSNKKGKYFKDVVFSNLVLSEEQTRKGYVAFDVSFSVDPALLSYEKQSSLYTTPVQPAVTIPVTQPALQTTPSITPTTPQTPVTQPQTTTTSTTTPTTPRSTPISTPTTPTTVVNP